MHIPAGSARETGVKKDQNKKGPSTTGKMEDLPAGTSWTPQQADAFLRTCPLLQKGKILTVGLARAKSGLEVQHANMPNFARALEKLLRRCGRLVSVRDTVYVEGGGGGGGAAGGGGAVRVGVPSSRRRTEPESETKDTKRLFTTLNVFCHPKPGPTAYVPGDDVE